MIPNDKASPQDYLRPRFVQPIAAKRNIYSIDYRMLSSEDMISMSKVEVTNPGLYDRVTQNVIPSGPLDLRMGVGNKVNVCQTCKHKLQNCPGHFGHYRLSVPVFHIGYFKHMLNVLKCVCKRCGKVLLAPEEKKKTLKRWNVVQKDYAARAALFKIVLKNCNKKKTCDYCKYENPGVQKVPKIAGKIELKQTLRGPEMASYLRDRGEPENMIKAFSQIKNLPMNPLEVEELLRKISIEEYPLLNIDSTTRMQNMLIRYIAVPPACIRPSVTVSNGTSNEDDITIRIRQAIALNQRLQQYIRTGQDVSRLQKDWYLLQSAIALYVNSDAPGLPLQEFKINKLIRSLATRLKGKQGRFRQNLSGKRSNYTGRTVISPDPNLHPTQVIVPEYMSKILTVSVPVTEKSLSFLRGCIDNGNKKGGANFVISADGSKTAVGITKINLKLGDVVERHLRDGDLVIFNRQPSLHRISMMGFRVKIAPGNTLRFNECCCTPFNADFDGDQMNIHVPQTLQARSQALHLMGVSNNIMNAKNGEPIIALIQDFLTTSFLITDKDMFFTRTEFCQIMSWITDANQHIDIPPPSIIKPKELWTGKQVISSLLRPNRWSRVVVNFQLKEKTYTKGELRCVRDGWVYFKNSELLQGQIGKTTLGGNKNGLLYALIRDNSSSVACEVMHRFAKLSSRWLTNFGMTIGLSDVTPSIDLSQRNKTIIDAAKEECRRFSEAYLKDTLQLKPGMSKKQSLESWINQSLSGVRQKIGDNCIKTLDKTNKPLIMSLCGSKGNPVNLSQMIGCVGQQTVGGRRIAYGFIERTLPHFARLSQSPEARGFVENSFQTGLHATQFFFHTMGGREGLIDTAVKTADTGYMQRRLIKILEDIAVMYDLTVRTCDKREIVQFNYGGDGLDPMKTEDMATPVHFETLELYVKSVVVRRHNEPYLTPSEIEEQISQWKNKISSENLFCTADVQKLFINHFEKCCEYMHKKAQKLKKILSTHMHNESVAEEDVLYLLNCKDGLTLRQFTFFMKNLVKKYNQAIMEPGEPVGAITAQSIGEPATQMTLKTFHFAGIASMNITQGVPRINQIINCAPNIATPIMTVYLSNPTFENAVATKGALQCLKLSQIARSIEEVLSASACYLVIELCNDVIAELKLEINMQLLALRIKSTPRTPIREVEVNQGRLLVYPLGKSNPVFELKTISRKIMETKIVGIESVKRTLITKQGKSDNYMIFAEGTGLKHVLKNMKVNPCRTYSNHILEIYDVLGIEATRQSIDNQITETMKEHGVTVDRRHIRLLSDTMTSKGRPIGFTRYGVDKVKDSTLMLASFEKTFEFLYDAAVQGKHDRMRGVSEKIIMGKPIPIGTGMFDLTYEFKKRTLFQNKAHK